MSGIVLVGFMGTGKTVIGRSLAARLQFSFVDTDDLIVEQAGKSISHIFAEDGEPAFRTLETRILTQLVATPIKERVIATGGGIVLADQNWPLLRQLGDVICLSAEPEVILQRVGLAQDRPLLAGTPAEVRLRIQSLLAQREAAYAKADWICNTSNRAPRMIVEEILRWREAKASQKRKE